MAGPTVVVLIPESTRKVRGGDPKLPPADAVAEGLPLSHRSKLLALRTEVAEKSPRGSIESGGLLPAHERFDGNMYREIPRDAWERRAAGVEVLMASGLLGLVASRDTVPRYEHSMAEPMAPFGKLNRWWHAAGLPAVLRAYLEATRPKIVVDLLSLEYRESVAGFGEGLRGVPVKVMDFPGMGRASQPLRGRAVADVLRTGKV